MPKHIAEQFPLPGVPQPASEQSPEAPLVIVDQPQPAEVSTQEDQYREMAAHLTEEHLAVSSMTRRCVFLGIKLLRLKDWLEENLSTRGQVSGGRGKTDGLAEWLRTYAPEIPRASAYRYMNMALAAREAFQLPTKAEKTLGGWNNFVTADPEELPLALQKKQQQLFDFLDGTSGRGLLDMVKPRKPLKDEPEPKPEEGGEEDDPIKEAMDLINPLLIGIAHHITLKQTWTAFVDGEQLQHIEQIRSTLESALSALPPRPKQ